jgi:hypothetical protein
MITVADTCNLCTTIVHKFWSQGVQQKFELQQYEAIKMERAHELYFEGGRAE